VQGVAIASSQGSAHCNIDARNAFVAEAHAAYDRSLQRFFAQRGVARDEIADLTQEVYLRLARQPDIGSIRDIQAFVFATALNLLRDRFRRQLTRGPMCSIEGDAVEILAEGYDPAKSAECEEQLHAVHAAIRSLKLATQHVFFGHRVRGQTYAELARELGVSVSMIEKHMICAIAALSPLR